MPFRAAIAAWFARRRVWRVVLIAFIALAVVVAAVAALRRDGPAPVDAGPPPVVSYDDRLMDFTRDYAAHPEAEWAIAGKYLYEPGAERDGELALIWLRRAMAHGFARAASDVANAELLISVPQYHLARVEPRMVEAAAAAPGTHISDCASCPTMVVLPLGKFMMGGNPAEPGHVRAEEPRHPVFVLKTIAVSQTPITFAQWDACAAAGACRKDLEDMGWGRGDRPAINVTWSDLSSYIDWLNASTRGGYRLLSESEWEFAARAGADSAYWWGEAMKPGYAHCLDCNATVPRSTAPVASYKANPFGLYDMAGNVWQWVADCPGNPFDESGPNYRSAPATSIPWMEGSDNNCNLRVLRGGAWDYDSSFARAGQRNWMISVEPDSDANIGFRVALVLGREE